MAQVLFCYEQFDELTLLHLREFDKKKLISVETDIVVDHYKEEKFEESSPGIVMLPCCKQSCCPVPASEGTPPPVLVQLLSMQARALLSSCHSHALRQLEVLTNPFHPI